MIMGYSSEISTIRRTRLYRESEVGSKATTSKIPTFRMVNLRPSSVFKTMELSPVFHKVPEGTTPNNESFFTARVSTFHATMDFGKMNGDAVAIDAFLEKTVS